MIIYINANDKMMLIKESDAREEID